MKRALVRVTASIAASVLLTVAACNTDATRRSADGVPEVVTTLFPIAMLTGRLAGDAATVTSLLPPGATPHTFDPLPTDVAKLQRASLVVEVGAGIDGWVRKLVTSAAPDARILTLAGLDGYEAVPANSNHRHEHGHDHDHGSDPHLWLDPVIVRDTVVPALVAALTAAVPAAAETVAAHARELTAELSSLDAEIRTMLRTADGTSYVALHNAWRYYARRYGLKEVAVVYEFAGEEPTPKELVAFVKAAQRAGIPAVLIEPQLSDRTARNIAREFGGSTEVVDPLGDPDDPERSSYTALMRFNTRSFSRALGGNGPPSDGGKP